jgi:hypothetical protein
MQLINLGLLSLLTFLLAAPPCFECPPVASVSESLRNSSSVFTGEVISEEYRDIKEDSPGKPENGKTLVIRFKVQRWWKGSRANEVTLYTSLRKYPDGSESFMAEDFRFQKGESYLVYAQGRAEKLWTSECTRTRKLAGAENDLRELGDGEAPKQKDNQ